jgi:leucyl aminopeptidase (aminopeptidase T)
MTDNYINDAYIAVLAQKLFRSVFCIVKHQQLAELVVQKALTSSVEKTATMNQAEWEKYVQKLTVRTAINCKNSTDEQKEKLLRRISENESNSLTTVKKEKRAEKKLGSMVGC